MRVNSYIQSFFVSEQGSPIDIGDESHQIYEPTSDNTMDKYPNLARRAIRYGVSSLAAAAICTSMMDDFNLINESVKINRSNVWRGNNRVMSTLRESHEQKGLVVIVFDLRKDDT